MAQSTPADPKEPPKETTVVVEEKTVKQAPTTEQVVTVIPSERDLNATGDPENALDKPVRTGRSKRGYVILMSKVGSWHEGEIVTLEDLDDATVQSLLERKAVRKAKASDFETDEDEEE